jgi:branched-chain amino acid transport system substrate-binding protein
MNKFKLIAATAAALGCWAASAHAEDNLKVGLITTLSGPPAVLGQQLRNGFSLALKQLGGKLGGRETDLIVADDELKPDVAVTKVKALLDRDKVDFVVGPIFSNILGAIKKPVTEAGVILISPNAGTSTFAGKECDKNLFVTSYQNDQVHEVLGEYAQSSGMKKVIIIVPNYQAGKDAAAGFKHKFSGEVLDEMYVPLGQLDYSAELSRIAASNPDAVFAFLPGGMGVNFVKQYRQAGLADKIPFLSAFTVDESTLPAQKDAALGMYSGANWAPNLDNPQNKAFVEAYLKEYNAVPATYAARRAQESRLQIAARRVQVQQQPLSNPELLPDQGRQAPRRQIRDRDRQDGVHGLRRFVRQRLSDEVTEKRAYSSRHPREVCWRRMSKCPPPERGRIKVGVFLLIEANDPSPARSARRPSPFRGGMVLHQRVASLRFAGG